MNLEEKTLKQEYIFNGKLINLRKDEVLLPNDKKANREVVEHSGGVGIVAINDNNEVLLVKQFRYPYKKVLLEIPAGKINKGENPLKCGIRELKEETGVVAEKIISLGEIYPSPGYCDEVICLYLATNLKIETTNPDEDEFLENISLPFDTALKMAENGEIKDAKTVIGLFRASKKI